VVVVCFVETARDAAVAVVPAVESNHPCRCRRRPLTHWVFLYPQRDQPISALEPQGRSGEPPGCQRPSRRGYAGRGSASPQPESPVSVLYYYSLQCDCHRAGNSGGNSSAAGRDTRIPPFAYLELARRRVDR
jgi:hypothetical protein